MAGRMPFPGPEGTGTVHLTAAAGLRLGNPLADTAAAAETRQQKEKKQRIRQQVNWGDFLTLLGNQVPSDCWLTRVEQQKEGKVLHLEGRSLKRNGALQLVKRLQQRPEVIQVKLDRLEQEERESDLTGFALQIRLKEEETHG